MPTETESFIEKWRGLTGKETGNLQPFILDLCRALGLPAPGVSAPGAEYCFEYSVQTVNEDGSAATDEIDLYRRGHFILEGKQTTESVRKGAGAAAQGATGNGAAGAPQLPLQRATGAEVMTAYDKAVSKAFGQAVRYAKDLALREEHVPFLIVCDVGMGFYIWDRFSGDYGRYASRRVIPLEDLARADVQDYLRAIWTDPLRLDPGAVTAAVTREIAAEMGELKKQLAEVEPDPKRIALFLMRVVFTFFAESIGLLPEGLFSAGLKLWEHELEHFQQGLNDFWAMMDKGGRFGHNKLKRFNGGLFKDVECLLLSRAQVRWMIQIAEKSWKDIDPAIFGALLEGALDTKIRKKFGIHYTPRAHIQRLVDATFGEELWKEWNALHDEAQTLLDSDHNEAEVQKMKAKLMAFRQKLGQLVILDPACGSGNFLYVAFDTLKRIEEEVITTLTLFGETKKTIQSGGEVITPAKLLGIEIDEWAASIAELVLWIAYIQWYCRLYPQSLSYGPIPEPVLQNYDSIEQRDAVLEWAATKETGRTRWGGNKITSKRTGKSIPDPTDQVPIYEYIDPRPAKWPKADYIVGNPPFLGNARLRDALGDGYAEALRAAYPDVPDTVDLVMYWWHRAALEVRSGRTRRFGLITTNTIKQVRQRGLVASHLEPSGDLPPLKILWAVPDHPWGGTTAMVRIAMTVGGLEGNPRMAWVADEGGGATPEERANSVALDQKAVEEIQADLATGLPAEPVPLKANSSLCSRGVLLVGDGFIVDEDRWEKWGRPNFVRPYVNGSDLVGKPRGLYVIDLFGMEVTEVKKQHPSIYQHLLDRVKPERDQNNRQCYRDNWWVFGEPRANIRPALEDLKRYIATTETTKHRVFVFLDANILADNKVIVMASEDAYHLGILSSKVHSVWFSARRSALGKTDVYNKSLCFDPFPFPDPAEATKAEIRALGEELDGHIKGAQARGATITQIYNVVELIRAGAALGAIHRPIHEWAATDILIEIHDKLDAVVSKAYGWPAGLSDEETLERLTSLNAERAAEEAAGKTRWLRPEYQCRDGR